MEETIRATVIKSNQAIKLTARKECIDRDGNARVTGEEWLVERIGAYLPGAYEEVSDIVNAYVLTEKVFTQMIKLRLVCNSVITMKLHFANATLHMKHHAKLTLPIT